MAEGCGDVESVLINGSTTSLGVLILLFWAIISADTHHTKPVKSACSPLKEPKFEYHIGGKEEFDVTGCCWAGEDDLFP
ncbi:hypothetical protein B0F90DRAFT_1770855 [Multifurca ochricompacta]|uniref:Uncharacterized protein n=1 Tax=Multifurca ochricompacta TaxID=376703 RepID=A0AAD4LW32_9AGAM|nr:hypothetical protein B0F90DRAFT_1770855 [Multifurca ochricompacta]